MLNVEIEAHMVAHSNGNGGANGMHGPWPAGAAGERGTTAFGDLVRQLAGERRRSVDWVARAIGLKEGSFRSYVNGRRKVPLDVVLRTADTFRVRPEPLMKAAGYDTTTGRAALSLAPGATLLVPVVGRVPADPGSRMEQATVPYQPHSPSVRPEFLVALRVDGECQSPDVQPNDYVIVDKSLEPLDGRLGVVLVDGAYALKRVRLAADGWHLESNIGPLVPYESAEWFGRVVFVGRSVV